MPVTAVPPSGKTNNDIASSSLVQTVMNGPGRIYRYIETAIQSKQGTTSKIFETWYGASNIVIQLETVLFDGLRGDILFPRNYVSPLLVVGAVSYKALQLLPNPKSTLGNTWGGLAQSIVELKKTHPTLTYLWRIVDNAADSYFFLFDVMYQSLLVNLRPIPEFGFCFAVGATIYAAIDNYSKGEAATAPLQAQQVSLLKQIGDTLITASMLASRYRAIDRALAPTWFPSMVVISIIALATLSYAIGQTIQNIPTTTQKSEVASSIPEVAQGATAGSSATSPSASTSLRNKPPSTQANSYYEVTLGSITKGARELFNRIEKLRREHTIVDKGWITINRAARIIVYGEVLIQPILSVFMPQAKNSAYIALGLGGLLYGITEAQVKAADAKAEAELKIKKKKEE